MASRELIIGSWDDDDDLIAAVRADRMPRVRVTRCANTVVVLGKGSRPEVELDVEACLADGVPVVKRHGGGCSVVLDKGNLIVSLVLPVRGFRNHRKNFTLITDWLIEGLARTGIGGVAHDGISDLVAGDLKVGGSCLYCPRDLLYYSSTLLVDPDLDRITRYLAHPPREPDYRRGRSHGDFMGRLSPDPWSGEITDLEDALRRTLLPGAVMNRIAGRSAHS